MPLAQSELLKRTLELLEQRPRNYTYAVINEQTGLPVQFLQNLSAGRLKDPGVQRIEILHNFLTQTKLVFVPMQPEFEPQSRCELAA